MKSRILILILAGTLSSLATSASAGWPYFFKKSPRAPSSRLSQPDRVPIRDRVEVNQLRDRVDQLHHKLNAERLYGKGEVLRETSMEPSSLALALAMNDVGLWRLHTGDAEAAQQLFAFALPVFEQHYGPEDHRLGSALSNLASAYRKLGKDDLARAPYTRAVRIFAKCHGEDHPKTAEAMNNLATVLRRQGEYISAEQLYRRTIRAYERALGAEHPHVAGVINNLALLYAAWERFDQASDMFHRSYRISHRQYGAAHPRTRQVLRNMAIMYERKDSRLVSEIDQIEQRSLTRNIASGSRKWIRASRSSALGSTKP